jgi:phospholipid transport system substrate-binding protein
MLRVILGLMVGLLSAASWAAEPPPDVLAKNTTEEVLAILKADKDIQGGNVQKIYDLVEAKVLPHFDFNRMTQLALGKHWNAASPKQKQSLVKEFRALLVRTYSTSLTAFSNQAIEFKPFSMKPEETEVTVRTEVKQPGGNPVPIDYAMYKTAFGWKVYDVSIDGVSLVINYRSSFANTIRQSGIDGLIKALETKSQSLEKVGPQPSSSGKPAAPAKATKPAPTKPAKAKPAALMKPASAALHVAAL